MKGSAVSGKKQPQPSSEELRWAFGVLSGFDFDRHIQGDPAALNARVSATYSGKRITWIDDEPLEYLEARVTDLLELLGWARPSLELVISRMQQHLSEYPQSDYRSLFESMKAGGRGIRVAAGERSLGQRMCDADRDNGNSILQSGGAPSELVSLLPPALDDWGKTVSNPKWQNSGLVIDDEELSLSELYVDVPLYSIDRDWNAKEPLPSRHGTVKAEAMYTSIPQLMRSVQWGDMAVVVGDPGAGKTALSKKITLEINQHERWGYTGAIWISLRQWATGPFLNRPSSLMQTFLKPYCPTLGTQELEQLSQALMLRCYRKANQSFKKDPVLIVLDGWDEVPEKLRNTLREIIRLELRDTPLLITSRPNTDLSRLNTLERFKIGRLSPSGQQTLIQRFFEATEQPTEGRKLSEQLVQWETGRYYAENPFLLSLLCRAWLTQPSIRQANGYKSVTRASLYEMGIAGILEDQKIRGVEEQLERDELRPLEELSRELLFGTEGRQYVFDDRHPQVQSFKDINRYEALSESRLLTRDLNERHRLEFIHASLQEYLAACSISKLEGDAATRHLRQARFLEYLVVFRFIIGMGTPGLAHQLLKALAVEAKEPDDAGLIDLVLAELLAEHKMTDGTQTPLRVDIRQRMWDRIQAQIDTDRQSRALAELDPVDMARRLLHRFERSETRHDEWDMYAQQLDQYIVQAGHLRRVEESADGATLLAKIERAVPGARASMSSLVELRRLVLDDSFSEQERTRALDYLAQWKDGWIEQTLRSCLASNKDHRLWPAFIDGLKIVGGTNAAHLMCDLLIHTERIEELSNQLLQSQDQGRWLGSLVTMLLWRRDGVPATITDRLRTHVEAVQRDRLMWSVLCGPVTCLYAPHRLAALENITISNATQLLTSWALTPGCPLRSHAVIALEGTSHPDACEAIADIAREEPDEDLRHRGLIAMMYGFPFPKHTEWLARRAADPRISDEERGMCIDILAAAARRNNNVTNAAHNAILALFQQTAWPDVFPPLLQNIDCLGPVVVPKIGAFIRDAEAPIALKAEACDTLREIDYTGPEEGIAAVLPTAKYAMELAENQGSESLLRAGARLMVEAHPTALFMQRKDLPTRSRSAIDCRAIVDEVLREWSRESDTPIVDGQVIHPDLGIADEGEEELVIELLSEDALKDTKRFMDLGELYLTNTPRDAFVEFVVAWSLKESERLSVADAYAILEKRKRKPTVDSDAWQRRISRACEQLLKLPVNTEDLKDLRAFSIQVGLLKTDVRKLPHQT